MKFVVAPDSFKESLTALAAAEAIRDGIRRVLPEADIDLVPMADGGEGLAQTLTDALGGHLVDTACHDALGREIRGAVGYVPATRLAIIEMAAASGLALIAPGERDVARASTRGTGELIAHALDAGARRFIIGLGGSATNDAGTGLLTALGVRFLDAAGAGLPPGGAALADLAAVDASGLDPRFAGATIEIACDVDNPLLGPRGASAVFGPQKGAAPAQVARLDAALTRWADVVEPTLGRAVRDLPGGGAAGGLGAGLAAFLPQAVLRRGIDIVVDAVRLRDRVRGADWVFTGEGGIDAQTSHGKTPYGVFQVAASAGVPVIMFGGRITPDAATLLDAGVTALVPIVRGVTTLTEALAHGRENLAAAAELTVRLLVARMAE
ncbi:MAG: glycerate kinase [Propionibacteriaceae bacterium]|jgi:glycerate kinase|nr:glycerate kinase [Propionibacteriaceae bacterium]